MAKLSNKFRSNYLRNKARAVFTNTEPSMTDQSQAADTDVNIIVKKYAVTGTAHGAPAQGFHADLTNIPEDLRGMIEESRRIQMYRHRLPEQLREMPLEKLLLLNPKELKDILEPDQQPTDKPKDEPKT